MNSDSKSNTKVGKARKTGRNKSTSYHEAAFNAFSYLLRDYVRNGDVTLSDVLDDATAKTVTNIVLKVNDEPGVYSLGFWRKIILRKHSEIILKEGNMLSDKKLRKVLAEIGMEQKIMQEGMQKGMREGIKELLQFLKSGHSIEEAEMRFAVQ